MVAGAPVAGAEEAGWKLTLLPMPAGHEDSYGYFTGTDGHGGYSGYIQVGDGAQVVTWTDGRPDLRGTPPGIEFARTDDQNQAGTVIGTGIDYDTGGSVPFTLDDNGFRFLPLPDGFREGSATAVNDRGDIVGSVYGDDTSVVLWPAGGVPRVLDLGLPSVDAADIDDDGTVLLNSDAGRYLWKDGMLSRLADLPDHYYTHVSAIRNGWVVGTAASGTQPGSQGFLWCRTGAPTTCQGATIALPRAAEADKINSTGLIVGRERTAEAYGPLAVWRGDQYLERLPVPAGHLATAGALAENGTVLGWVSPTSDPTNGGQPAVWTMG
jgi:hypothetical protein